VLELGRLAGRQFDGHRLGGIDEIVNIDPIGGLSRLSHSRDVATYIIASNARRHVSKGQQAMAVAMMHPEPAKTKRKGSPDDAAPAELAVAATKDTFGNPPFAGALTQPATLSRRLRRSRRHRRPRPLPSRIRGVSIVETACGLD
jgi:hypothetical protein